MILCRLLVMIWAVSGYSSTPRKVAVVGGGASGIFAAIHAATQSRTAQVTVLEATRKTLQKVKISGGGRCNVLHDSSKPPQELLNGYPRGGKELRGLLHKHFPAPQAAAWFKDHGVGLKTEPDGRMFPTTDSSQTVIDALLSAAHETGVTIQTQTKVENVVAKTDDGNRRFEVSYVTPSSEPQNIYYDAVILATGSTRLGYQLARDQLEQPFVDTVPSLFTMYTAEDVREGGLLHGLAGISLEHVEISFRDTQTDSTSVKGGKNKKRKADRLTQEGPMLITHQGFSGPAALRLSAFGAREMAACRYQGELTVNWAPNEVDVFDTLWKWKSELAKTKVTQFCPFSTTVIPKRLWVALVEKSIGTTTDRWTDLSKAKTRALAHILQGSTFELTGKGTFKEEFVTAGGISLTGIDMKTMQCKTEPGLFVCGELIDVDGITGGYNFMNCWGTGYVAGTSAAQFVDAL